MFSEKKRRKKNIIYGRTYFSVYICFLLLLLARPGHLEVFFFASWYREEVYCNFSLPPFPISTLLPCVPLFQFLWISFSCEFHTPSSWKEFHPLTTDENCCNKFLSFLSFILDHQKTIYEFFFYFFLLFSKERDSRESFVASWVELPEQFRLMRIFLCVFKEHTPFSMHEHCEW